MVVDSLVTTEIFTFFSSPLPTSIYQEWMGNKGESRNPQEKPHASHVLVISAVVIAYSAFNIWV